MPSDLFRSSTQLGTIQYGATVQSGGEVANSISLTRPKR